MSLALLDGEVLPGLLDRPERLIIVFQTRVTERLGSQLQISTSIVEASLYLVGRVDSLIEVAKP